MIRYFLVVLLVVSSCNIKLDGRPGKSDNVKESKDRKVFLHQYKVTEEIPQIGKISEAWIEHSWRFTKYNLNDIDVDTTHSQLCINMDKSTLDSLFQTWSIEKDDRISYYGLIGNTLVISFNTLQQSDTLKFNVLRGDNDLDANDSLGTILFVKSN